MYRLGKVKMRQMKLVNDQKFEVEEVLIPKPKRKEILIQIKRVGICGSDLHIYRGENPVIQAPVILGHEAVGVVTEVGPEVNSFKEGQRVAIMPYVSCGRCRYCQSGYPNVCENLLIIGGMVENGAFAEYIVLPEDFVIDIPESVSLEEAVLIEPTTVAVHAVKRVQNISGKDVAILGTGTIGLLILQVAKIYGVEKILVADVVDEKLKIAAKLGAVITINLSSKNYLRTLEENNKSGRFDAVFDCVTNQATIRLAFDLVKKAQKIVAVGIPTGEVGLDFIPLICNELNLLGSSLCFKQEFLEARQLIKDKRINTSFLVSKQFSFADTAKAFQEIEESRGKLVKVILNME